MLKQPLDIATSPTCPRNSTSCPTVRELSNESKYPFFVFVQVIYLELEGACSESLHSSPITDGCGDGGGLKSTIIVLGFLLK